MENQHTEFLAFLLLFAEETKGTANLINLESNRKKGNYEFHDGKEEEDEKNKSTHNNSNNNSNSVDDKNNDRKSQTI